MKHYNKFLIVFSNIKGNVGDFAILHAELEDLHHRFPNHELHVAAHGFHKEDQNRLEAFKKQAPAHVYPWKCPVKKLNLVAKLISKFGFKRIAQNYSIKSHQRQFENLEEIKSVSKYDAIFISGGGQWIGQYLGVNMFAMLNAIHKYNPEIYTYPFSIYKEIFNFNTPGKLNSYFGKFKRSALVRESGSHEVLKKIGSNSTLGADCVFSLAKLADSTISSQQAINKTIVFAVTQTVGSGLDVIDKCISFLKKENYSITLLTTCEVEDESHLRLLSEKHNIPYSAPLSWQDTVSQFKSSSLVVTNRLHCMIFSFFAQVPVIPLMNRDKIIYLCNDASLPISIESLNELDSHFVEKVFSERDNILMKMSQYLVKTESLKTSPLDL